MIVADFFSGCGGASQGLKQAGFNIALGLDFDKDAGASYKANFPEAVFLEKDIQKVDECEVSGHIEEARRNNYEPLLLTACAPCQPFSSQNKNKSNDDIRRGLLDETHRFIRTLMPEYIMIENVPGIQNVDDSADGPFRRFTNLLNELGYFYTSFVARSETFGVPQRRKRLVMIASLISEVEKPAPTHGDSLLPFKTVRDAISDLPTLAAGKCHIEDKLHVSAAMREKNLLRIQHTPEGGDRRNWPKNLINECHKNYSGHTDTYGRMCWDLPAPTLTTKCHSYTNGRFGHPDTTQNRAISIREAACLQTFPRDYVFHGNLGSMARQIGNAVPTKLAERFGLTILEHYRRNI